jgi:AraC-like DNA-binding protein
MDQTGAGSPGNPTVAEAQPQSAECATPERRAPAAYGRTIWQFDFEPSAAPARYQVKLCSLPGLGVALSTTSASRVRRAAHHLVNDDLVLRINLSGSRTLTQCGREAVLGPGAAVLSSGAEVSAAVTTEQRFLSFRVPLNSIKALVPTVEDRVARTIPREADGLPLLTHYGELLLEGAAIATPQLRQLAVTHVNDLIALTLGATGDHAATARLRGVRAARLAEIKAGINARLAEQDLSVAVIARHHRLPVRYVQRLFEADGSTFTEFLLERRLAHAHRALSDPRCRARPIGTIAFESGFANQAYFNRTFRARFGATPSDIRSRRPDC